MEVEELREERELDCFRDVGRHVGSRGEGGKHGAEERQRDGRRVGGEDGCRAQPCSTLNT